MPNYNFKKDLSIAKKTEAEVAGHLARIYTATIISFDDTNKYDFLLKKDGRLFKMEVKEDFMCQKTGNVGLEFGCRGKPSGIETSEADYYIYKVHTKDQGVVYVMHSTKTLKQMIVDKRYSRIVSGGDPGSNSMNYLFKYEVFVASGKILDFGP